MHVLIAGGGIAGLTTAIALRQRGVTSTVFESAPAGRAPLQLTDAAEWERYGRRTVVIHRQALHEVLRGALADDAV